MMEIHCESRPALEEAFAQQRLPLLRLAYLLSGSRDAAEDHVQAAFLSAHQNWQRIEDPGAYLRRAVVNRVKDEQRRTFRRRSYVLPPEPEPVTRQPEIDETWHRVRRLPDRQRAVVVLRFYEDLALVDIARLLERPPSTIRSDLRRALDRLRKELS